MPDTSLACLQIQCTVTHTQHVLVMLKLQACNAGAHTPAKLFVCLLHVTEVQAGLVSIMHEWH